MAKCPSCPQFTSKDTDTDPEGELEVDAIGVINGDIRIVNTCAECGTELEEATFQIEVDLSAQAAGHFKVEHEDKEQELSVQFDVSRTDEISRKDRNGKPIANPRYQKRMYGVEGEVRLICDECGVEIYSEKFADSVQASGMEWIA